MEILHLVMSLLLHCPLKSKDPMLIVPRFRDIMGLSCYLVVLFIKSH